MEPDSVRAFAFCIIERPGKLVQLSLAEKWRICAQRSVRQGEPLIRVEAISNLSNFKWLEFGVAIGAPRQCEVDSD